MSDDGEGRSRAAVAAWRISPRISVHWIRITALRGTQGKNNSGSEVRRAPLIFSSAQVMTSSRLPRDFVGSSPQANSKFERNRAVPQKHLCLFASDDGHWVG